MPDHSLVARASDIRSLGFNQQPDAMKWVYCVAFNQKSATELLWITTDSQDVCEASKQAAKNPRTASKTEYGHSKQWFGRWFGHWYKITKPIQES